MLQYIADRSPASKLAPPAGTMERYRLMEWLSFINSEVHKSFTPHVPQGHPRGNPTSTRVGNLSQAPRTTCSARSARKTFLMGEQFTVADCLPVTPCSAGRRFVKLDLGKWPELKRYVDRIRARPHVQSRRSRPRA